MRRPIASLDVRCPSCGALPGARCRAVAHPDTYVGAHEARRRKAREEQARLNPEHTEGQLPLFPKTGAGPVRRTR